MWLFRTVIVFSLPVCAACINCASSCTRFRGPRCCRLIVRNKCFTNELSLYRLGSDKLVSVHLYRVHSRWHNVISSTTISVVDFFRIHFIVLFYQSLFHFKLNICSSIDIWSRPNASHLSVSEQCGCFYHFQCDNEYRTASKHCLLWRKFVDKRCLAIGIERKKRSSVLS